MAVEANSDVLTRRDGRIGRVSLNRPRALHALTLEMTETIIAALLDWRGRAEVEAVMIDHAGERGFCSGGDIRAAAADADLARRFFLAEYRLNALMVDYPKPLIVVMDGVTMGGGVGLAMPARYRIATERTLWAMPEAAIGLFPDVGMGRWLSRLPGAIGVWLALTGARLRAADCLLLGLATDHVASGDLEALKAAVARDPATVETLLTECEADAGEPPLSLVQDDIDRLFDGPDVEAVAEALRRDAGDWAKAQAALLAAGSPTSLKVAHRLIAEGAAVADFHAEMIKEYRLAVRIAAGHDFREGVRALLIDKDARPRWSPAALESVTDDQLDRLFAPLPCAEWSPVA